MKRQDHVPEKRTEPRSDERVSRERAVAPPIPREHETQEGVFEEEEEQRGYDDRRD